MEFSVAVAKYDYKAESEGELTIRKNEKLTIIDDSQPWWKVQNEKSHSGYVPSNYLNRKDSVNKRKKKIIENLNKSKGLKNKRTSLEDGNISDCQSPKLGNKGNYLMFGSAKLPPPPPPPPPPCNVENIDFVINDNEGGGCEKKLEAKGVVDTQKDLHGDWEPFESVSMYRN